MDEERVSFKILDDVCIDCSDFLAHKCVGCEDCPVQRLKERSKKRKKGATQ
jgi:hypothetical protein